MFCDEWLPRSQQFNWFVSDSDVSKVSVSSQRIQFQEHPLDFDLRYVPQCRLFMTCSHNLFSKTSEHSRSVTQPQCHQRWCYKPFVKCGFVAFEPNSEQNGNIKTLAIHHIRCGSSCTYSQWSELVLSSPTVRHYSNPYSTWSSSLQDFFVTFY